MRVITGKLGRRTFESPKSKLTHPMGEKIRGAIFGTLGDIEGLSVLDAFAGSGALSIEAISRGAVNVLALDLDKDAIRVMQENAEKLRIDDEIVIMQTNASGWSGRNKDSLFDIVFLDPPYNDVRPDILRKLAAHAKVGGTVVISLPPMVKEELLKDGYERMSAKTYGIAQIIIYKVRSGRTSSIIS